ncbi:MAG: efflux RND transporter periplasmic adaptor subunit [Acidobacteriia bacterium]|nr:efflux RND transporter periplasmic adaptor subunit [Terriglobia bacterium]
MEKHTITGGILILLAGGLFAACGSTEKAKEAQPETIRGVRLETVRLQPLPDFYEATGTVRSATTSVLSTQISGTVLEVRVKAGDRVRRGQLLATIDDRGPRAQVAAAQAGVEEAVQGLAEVEQAIQAAAAERQFAEASYRRYQGLLAKNSVSRQEFDDVETKYKAALANERAVEAKKKQIEARGEQARSQQASAQTLFSYSRVTSPIDGVVTEKSVDPGTVVMPGMLLLTVEDTTRYRLEASLPEQLLLKVSLGTAVRIRTERGEFQGRIAEIVPAADVASRTFLVKLDLPKDCACRSGEYGTAGFTVGEERRLSVPRSALIEHGELEGVFVANPEGVLEYRLVKAGKELGERVEILSGIAEGDRVATSQVDRLRDGARVEEQ